MPQTFIEHFLCDLPAFCMTCNTEIRLIKAEPYKGATFFALLPLSTRNPHLTLCSEFTNLYQFKMRCALTLPSSSTLSVLSLFSHSSFCASSNMLLPTVVCLCSTLYLQRSSPSLNWGSCLEAIVSSLYLRGHWPTHALSSWRESPPDMSSQSVTHHSSVDTITTGSSVLHWTLALEQNHSLCTISPSYKCGDWGNACNNGFSFLFQRQVYWWCISVLGLL